MQPFGENGGSFLPTDNEPLAHLYRHWTRSGKMDASIGRALTDGQLVASWKCDEAPKSASSMRFRGVKTAFHERGLKLAHISDAASRGIAGSLDEQIAIRFLRSLSPLNVFLFPNSRCCEFRLISSEINWEPTRVDWAEDPELQKMTLGWLAEWIGAPLFDALPDFGGTPDRTKSRLAEDG